MRYIITIIFAAITLIGKGQTPTQQFNGNLYQYNFGHYVKGSQFIPRDTTSWVGSMGDSGRIAYKNNVFYGRNLTSWQPFALGDLSLYYTKVQSDTTFRNYVQAKRYGAKGDGTLNDSAAISHAADSNYSVFLNQGDYLISGLNNPKGAQWFGDGRILKNITGGTQQLNSYADKNQHVFGTEYMAYVHRKLLERADASTVIKVIWSGDSTTFGDGADNDYKLNNLFEYLMRSYGIGNVSSINAGHSGATTTQWSSTYLSTDLAQNPDLYILRWGINDGSLGTVSSFITALRAGLSSIRATRDVSELTIILMTPNSTSDTPNGRDEKFYEQINQAVRQAARDFQCVFIDTYAMWKDSRPAANVWMDDPFSDGRAIHPLNIMNTWIVSKVSDVFLPSAYIRKVQTSKVQNFVSVDRLLNPTALPPSMEYGLTLDRAFRDTYPAWPIDGQTISTKQADGVTLQVNSPYLAKDSGRVHFRTSSQGISDPPSAAVWGPWQRFVSENSGGVAKIDVGLTVGTSTLGSGNSVNFSGGNISNTSAGSTFSSALSSGSAGLTLNNGTNVWQWGVNNGASGSTNHSFIYNAGLGDYQMSFNISGNTGVKTTAPSSTLHVAGSFATAITTTGSNINLTADHGTLIATSALTVTLPTAASAPGRIYYIVNYNTGGNVTFSIGVLKGGATVTTMTNNAAWRLQSNGTSWYVTGE